MFPDEDATAKNVDKKLKTGPRVQFERDTCDRDTRGHTASAGGVGEREDVVCGDEHNGGMAQVLPHDMRQVPPRLINLTG